METEDSSPHFRRRLEEYIFIISSQTGIFIVMGNRKLFSNSIIVFVGTIIGSFFSYLFNMLMGRYLGPTEYGEMTALMSFLMIISVAGSAILTITMRYSSQLYAENKYSALKRLLSFFTKYIYVLSLAIILICLVLIKPIANYFSISSLLPVAIAFSSLIFGLVVLANKGFLQGTHQFSAVSFIGAIEMALRLVLGVILVKIGFQVSGALAAVVLATAISYFITFWPINSLFKKAGTDKTETNFRFDKKEILSYSWPTLITSVLLIVALNIDIILVKHYFPAYDAGIYAAISTIAKIILYITAPVITVMFPMISEKTTKGDKHYSIFLLSLLMVAVGSFLILGLYVVAPAKIIGILYGPSYISFFYLLPEIGMAVLLYSLINLVVNYYMVIKNFIFVWFFLLDLILMTIAISIWHSSIVLVVRIMIASYSLLFASIMVYYLLSKKEQIKAYFSAEGLQ